MGWTILRNNIYTDQLLGSLKQAITTGKFVSAAGTGRTAYVSRKDCARAAASAICSSFDGKRILDVTGPDAVTHADIAAIVGDIASKQIAYEHVSPDIMVSLMMQSGLPKPVAEGYVTFDITIAKGGFEKATETVAELTGRRPTSVREFLLSRTSQLLG